MEGLEGKAETFLDKQTGQGKAKKIPEYESDLDLAGET